MINPVSKRFHWGNIYFPSLGLPLLAAMSPEWMEIEIIDEFQTPLKRYPLADIVIISVLTASAPRAYEIGDHYRSIGIPVVMGGIHVSVLPKEALGHADTVIVGEGDYVWEQVMEDFRKGEMKRVYTSPKKEKLHTMPSPRWDLIKMGGRGGNREVIYSVQAGRGCPSGCNFCNVPTVFGRGYRKRDINEVLRDIENVQGRKVLMIDDNLIANPQFAKELLRGMIPLEKEWFGLASMAYLKNDLILDLLQESGCRYLFIGFESTDANNIKLLGKGVNKTENYSEIIKKITSRGIKIIGSFIVGLDYDTERVFQDIYDFVGQNDIYVPIVNILTPYPGTELYKGLKEQGRIITEDWNLYSCDEVVFEPKRMSAQTLKEKHHQLTQELLKGSRERFMGRGKKGYSIYDF